MRGVVLRPRDRADGCVGPPYDVFPFGRCYCNESRMHGKWHEHWTPARLAGRREPAFTRGEPQPRQHSAMSDDVTRDLIQKFRAVTLDRLERLTLAVLDLEGDPSQQEALDTLNRELHTLKGEAKMMGFADVNLVAHRLEDMLKGAQGSGAETWPEGLSDLMLRGLDALGMLVQKTSAEGEMIDLHELLTQFDEFSRAASPAEADEAALGALSASELGELDPGAVPTEPDVRPPEEKVEEPSPGEHTETQAETTTTPELANAAPTKKRERSPTSKTKALRGATGRISATTLLERTEDTSIRIDLDKLDQLLVQAGDLILSHNRSAQRLSTLRELREKAAEHLEALDELTREAGGFDGGALGARPLSSADGHAASRIYGSGEFSMPSLSVSSATLPSQAEGRLGECLRQLTESGRAIHAQLERAYRDVRDDIFRDRQQLEQLEINVKELRLLPIGTVLRRYPRAVRDLARDREKEMRIEIFGESVSLDKRILDQISEPLLHLVRNSIDHGIEPPEQRDAVDKPRAGLLRLAARSAGAMVEIEVADDGRGIDPTKLVRKAQERGLISASEAQTLSEERALELIFESGFSTAEEVSDISGRGVGLDAVRNSIERLGGTLQLSTDVGRGTSFTLQLPVRVAIGKAQIVRLGQERVAIPSEEIEKIMRVPAEELVSVGSGRGLPYQARGIQAPGQIRPRSELDELTKHASYSSDEHSLFNTNVEEELVPVLGLARLLRMPSTTSEEWWELAVINHGGRRIALRVDDFLGEEEILHRPFDPFMHGVTAFTGTTILPDGSVTPILNIVELMRLAERSVRARSHDFAEETEPVGETQDGAKSALLVEDSEITRELLMEILRNLGLHVVEAKNGREGLELLRQRPADLIVTDIDMPEMDGFEMLERLRAEPEYYNIPVIVLTTRGEDEDKRRALDLGANAYLVKTEFQEDNLAETVARLLGL